jgi:hypothetical protein
MQIYKRTTVFNIMWRRFKCWSLCSGLSKMFSQMFRARISSLATLPLSSTRLARVPCMLSLRSSSKLPLLLQLWITLVKLHFYTVSVSANPFLITLWLHWAEHMFLFSSVNKHILYIHSAIANAYKLHGKFLPISYGFLKDEVYLSVYWTGYVWFPAQTGYCYCHENVQAGSEVHPTSCSTETGGKAADVWIRSFTSP